jgi:peroxiredoxin
MYRNIAVGLLAAVLFAPAITKAAPLKAGADAPELELPMFNSTDTFKLSSYKGKQAVILEFSQSACGSCKGMTDLLKSFAGKSKDYEIIMVNVDYAAGSEKWTQNMKSIVESEGIPMKIVMDPKFKVGPQFGVTATPALVVIDKSGKYVATHVGFDDEQRDAIKKLIESAK